jgi:branched-chain amino acid aminotransferase
MQWLDGCTVDGSKALFDLCDRGLMLGDGAFDTSLAINGTVVFADHHVSRLAGSCEALGIPMPPMLIGHLLQTAAAEICTGTLRLTVTRGAGPRGLLPPPVPKPHTILSAWPGLPAAIWRPVTAVTATIARNETSPTSRHKCLGYLDAVLALSAAAGTGAEEALFYNTTGHAACAAAGNIFALHGDELKTPMLEDGALAGVVRAKLLALAPKVGLTPVECNLEPRDLACADAVFITNSLRLIAPVLALDGKPLATKGFSVIAQLANALSSHIEHLHGASPWTEKGLSRWPICA